MKQGYITVLRLAVALGATGAVGGCAVSTLDFKRRVAALTFRQSSSCE